MNKTLTHTISVEFDVSAPNKEKATKLLEDYLVMAAKEFAIEQRIITWQTITEPNCSGYRNDYPQQGKPI